jgi:hypothetical protein
MDMADWEFEKDRRAMAAARESLAARGDRRKSQFTYKTAGDKHGVSEKYVKNAAALLRSGMDHLVWEVDQGKKKLRIAYREYRRAVTGDSGHNPGIEGLYAIVEKDSTNWWKFGTGRVTDRFDDLQQGNPRTLYLKSMWQFNDLADAKAAEIAVLATCSPSDSGTEWVSNVDYGTIYRLAVENGGTFMADVPGFDQDGRRLPRNRVMQA